MTPINRLPVFALNSESDWDDLLNALQASVNYQLNKFGHFYPLHLFAPLTEPANADVWEPLKTLPENLLMVSMERCMDARVLNALLRAQFVCGPTPQTGDARAIPVDMERPLAEVYQQMASANLRSFAFTKKTVEDPSFFFLRGEAAVKAFAKELPNARR
jgi:hypothetical protein